MHGKKAEEEQAREVEPKVQLPPTPATVDEAKLRFLKAANEFSPLGVVRRNPYKSMGVAFLAGFGLSSLGASRTAPSSMALISQALGLLSQFAPFLITRARSSDG